MAKGSRLNWKGAAVKAALTAAAVDAVSEVDLRIEGEAKAELYPGHGKRTGTLQRAIQGAPGRVEGRRVRGYVGTKGVRYALIQHKRYQYIANGVRRVAPQAGAILAKHAEKHANG